MSNALRNSIHQMAADFASSVLKAIRGASLEDILTESQAGGGGHGAAAAAPRRGPGRPRRNALPAAGHATGPAAHAAPAPKAGKARSGRRASGRLGRRSPSDIANVVKRIVALLESHPNGLRAEQIRASLSLQSKELPRPIADALSGHKISKVGEKRATTYFAGRRAAAAGAAKAGAAAKPGRSGKRGKRGKRKAG